MADVAIAAANVLGSNQATRRREFTLGFASAAAGQIVVLNASNQWVKTDSNGGAGVNITDTVGMLETGGGTNQPATVIVEDPNLTLTGSSLSNGVAYYAGPNAGNVSPVADVGAGNVGILLGMARTPNTMYFKPIISGATI